MAYVKIKPGVDISNLAPEITKYLWETANAFDELGHECVITSARRPADAKFSWHQYGKAIDLRANHIARRTDVDKILAKLKVIYGSDYDIIAHGSGPNFHFHIEYDPDG